MIYTAKLAKNISIRKHSLKIIYCSSNYSISQGPVGDKNLGGYLFYPFEFTVLAVIKQKMIIFFIITDNAGLPPNIKF